MDYRKRNYFLIKIELSSEEYFKNLCNNICDLKIKYHSSQPILQTSKNLKSNLYDNLSFYPTYMVSCLKENSDAFEYELQKRVRRDEGYSNYIKLSKEICKQ